MYHCHLAQCNINVWSLTCWAQAHKSSHCNCLTVAWRFSLLTPSMLAFLLFSKTLFTRHVSKKFLSSCCFCNKSYGLSAARILSIMVLAPPPAGWFLHALSYKDFNFSSCMLLRNTSAAAFFISFFLPFQSPKASCSRPPLTISMQAKTSALTIKSCQTSSWCLLMQMYTFYLAHAWCQPWRAASLLVDFAAYPVWCNVDMCVKHSTKWTSTHWAEQSLHSASLAYFCPDLQNGILAFCSVWTVFLMFGIKVC